jgi:DNA polymerase (family X)
MDIKKIMEAAKKHHCMLELNAHPDRLDLTDIHCTMAKDMGVPIVISTDAHHIDHLAYMRFGVGQARRGWLEKKDVLNTRTLTELLSIIKK